eukprot:tig00020848_g14618.t1
MPAAGQVVEGTTFWFSREAPDNRPQSRLGPDGRLGTPAVLNVVTSTAVVPRALNGLRSKPDSVAGGGFGRRAHAEPSARASARPKSKGAVAARISSRRPESHLDTEELLASLRPSASATEVLQSSQLPPPWPAGAPGDGSTRAAIAAAADAAGALAAARAEELLYGSALSASSSAALKRILQRSESEPHVTRPRARSPARREAVAEGRRRPSRTCPRRPREPFDLNPPGSHLPVRMRARSPALESEAALSVAAGPTGPYGQRGGSGGYTLSRASLSPTRAGGGSPRPSTAVRAPGPLRAKRGATGRGGRQALAHTADDCADLYAALKRRLAAIAAPEAAAARADAAALRAEARPGPCSRPAPCSPRRWLMGRDVQVMGRGAEALEACEEAFDGAAERAARTLPHIAALLRQAHCTAVRLLEAGLRGAAARVAAAARREEEAASRARLLEGHLRIQRDRRHGERGPFVPTPGVYGSLDEAAAQKKGKRKAKANWWELPPSNEAEEGGPDPVRDLEEDLLRGLEKTRVAVATNLGRAVTGLKALKENTASVQELLEDVAASSAAAVLRELPPAASFKTPRGALPSARRPSSNPSAPLTARRPSSNLAAAVAARRPSVSPIPLAPLFAAQQQEKAAPGGPTAPPAGVPKLALPPPSSRSLGRVSFAAAMARAKAAMDAEGGPGPADASPPSESPPDASPAPAPPTARGPGPRGERGPEEGALVPGGGAEPARPPPAEGVDGRGGACGGRGERRGGASRGGGAGGGAGAGRGRAGRARRRRAPRASSSPSPSPRPARPPRPADDEADAAEKPAGRAGGQGAGPGERGGRETSRSGTSRSGGAGARPGGSSSAGSDEEGSEEEGDEEGYGVATATLDVLGAAMETREQVEGEVRRLRALVAQLQREADEVAFQREEGQFDVQRLQDLKGELQREIGELRATSRGLLTAAEARAMASDAEAQTNAGVRVLEPDEEEDLEALGLAPSPRAPPAPNPFLAERSPSVALSAASGPSVRAPSSAGLGGLSLLLDQQPPAGAHRESVSSAGRGGAGAPVQSLEELLRKVGKGRQPMSGKQVGKLVPILLGKLAERHRRPGSLFPEPVTASPGHGASRLVVEGLVEFFVARYPSDKMARKHLGNFLAGVRALCVGHEHRRARLYARLLGLPEASPKGKLPEPSVDALGCMLGAFSLLGTLRAGPGLGPSRAAAPPGPARARRGGAPRGAAEADPETGYRRVDSFLLLEAAADALAAAEAEAVADLAACLPLFDADADGLLSLDEFLAFVAVAEPCADDELVESAFEQAAAPHGGAAIPYPHAFSLLRALGILHLTAAQREALLAKAWEARAAALQKAEAAGAAGAAEAAGRYRAAREAGRWREACGACRAAAAAAHRAAGRAVSPVFDAGLDAGAAAAAPALWPRALAEAAAAAAAGTGAGGAGLPPVETSRTARLGSVAMTEDGRSEPARSHRSRGSDLNPPD